MKELILKDIQPLNTQILTTAERYTEDGLAQNGLILDVKKTAGSYKLYQTVLSVGPMVRQLKPGDVIAINPIQYIKPEHPEDEDSVRGVVKVRNTYTKIELPILMVDGEERMLLQERDADFIIKSYVEK